MRRARQNKLVALLTRPVVLGVLICAAALIGLNISYNATRGIPLVPTYQVAVDVRDAAELVEGGSEVRIGGARVGLVTQIEAMPAEGEEPAFARLTLTLTGNTEDLPIDSRVAVRNRSLLGAKYLDLIPGSATETVPDGGTLATEKLEAPVEIDEAVEVFDDRTRRAIQGALTGLGDGFAGRGEAVNRTLAALGQAIEPLERVLGVLAAPDTDLDGFVRGAHVLARALEPVTGSLGSAFDAGATTLEALAAAGDSLPATLAELPPTEAVGTSALRALTPVLADAAAIAHEIRPATALLPETSAALADAFEGAYPVLAGTPTLADDLNETLAAVEALLRNERSGPLFEQLTATVVSVGDTLDYVLPAQVQCNFLGLYMRNVPSIVSGGDRFGSWLNVLVLLKPELMLQSATQAETLHMNVQPHLNYRECESGNEPYEGGRLVGNPIGLQQNTTELTEPPAGVTELAAEAGLLGSSLEP